MLVVRTVVVGTAVVFTEVDDVPTVGVEVGTTIRVGVTVAGAVVAATCVVPGALVWPGTTTEPVAVGEFPV